MIKKHSFTFHSERIFKVIMSHAGMDYYGLHYLGSLKILILRSFSLEHGI